MELKELAQKRRFSNEEKLFLREKAAENYIKFTERAGCQACFQDLAIEIYNKTRKKEPVKSKYQLKDGVDVVIVATGERINAATMTDAWAEKLIKAGLKKYFVHNADNI